MISLQVGVGGIDIYISDNQHCCIYLSKLSVADNANLFFMRCFAFNTDRGTILNRSAIVLLSK